MTKKIKWGVLDLVLLAISSVPVAAAALLYDQLPQQMAAHYDFHGKVDRYQDKFSFLLMMGAVTVGIPLIIKLTRYIDPKRANYDKFDRTFDVIRIVITLFLSALFGYILYQNLGHTFNLKVLLIMTGALFLVLGNYTGQLRFNYSMGIRTPWTLASEEVWRRTHRMAGPLWMLCGLIVIIAVFIPGVTAAWLIGFILCVTAIVPTLYSYLLYRRMAE